MDAMTFTMPKSMHITGVYISKRFNPHPHPPPTPMHSHTHYCNCGKFYDSQFPKNLKCGNAPNVKIIVCALLAVTKMCMEKLKLVLRLRWCQRT